MSSAVRHLTHLICLLALACTFACNNNNSSDAAEKDSKETANAVKAEEDGEKEEAEEELPKIDNDIYPDFALDAFSAKEKVKLTKLMKAELCPCPDSSESLHQCMQSKEKRCGLAEQALNMMGGMIKSSYNDTDILDQVAQFLEAAKQKHQFVLDDRPFKGNPEADVVLVEFADFECPHCKLASGMISEIAEKYGDKIAIYFKQYPLPAHQHAALAARASLAAHRQGKFWKMHDQLFKNQKSLSEDKIIKIAQRLGLNMGKFKKDLAGEEIGKLVAVDRQDGEKSGITGTPTIYINGRRYLGETSVGGITGAIEDAFKNTENTETTN